MNLLFKQGGVIFYSDPLAADDSKPDSDNIRIMIMTKVAPHWILIITKVAPHWTLIITKVASHWILIMTKVAPHWIMIMTKDFNQSGIFKTV